MRYPFQCPNNVFDGIFCEHTLEHFSIDDVSKILKEIYRILKPKGTLRLSVPHLALCVERYLQEKQIETKKALASEHIRKLTQEYLHLSVWDYERLEYELTRAGFEHIECAEYGKGRDTLLIFDLKQRAHESLYVEASKK